MTLDDAFVLQEKRIARFNGKSCPHNLLINQLLSQTGKDTGYRVCMECGEVFLELSKPLSPTEFKTLVQLTSDEV